ncbi:MAG: hypothetical protein IPJ87_06945 [Flavobacteriales bacterium]|jgi:predicted transcriptional regulator|nr:hypothetical protein [Flavobacteriales bacterium]MBK7941597.1 hypothetical protein [Flavobacteriales bacterium]MBK9700141.1 hypothetical protein [Flavobacteriales bacterium]
MTAVQLKSRLIELIQKEGDESLLQLVSRLMEKSTKKDSLRALMTERTLRGEEDIAAGRTLTHEQAVARVKAHIRKRA